MQHLRLTDFFDDCTFTTDQKATSKAPKNAFLKTITSLFSYFLTTKLHIKYVQSYLIQSRSNISNEQNGKKIILNWTMLKNINMLR